MSTQPRSNADAKRRGQALAGTLSGLAVVIVLVAVFYVVKDSDNNKPAAAAAPAAAPASQPAEQPTADPSAADPQAQPTAQPTAPPVNVKIPAALSKAPTVTAGKGKVTKIKITPIVQGKGAVVKKGQTLIANYVVATYKDGKVVDSSWTAGKPFSTPIGVGKVIPGWDDSIPGQRIGSRLQIDVPEADAYPGQGDLRFIVDLLAAK